MTNKGQAKYCSNPISATNQKYCNYRDKKKIQISFCRSLSVVLIGKKKKYLKKKIFTNFDVLLRCPINGATGELCKKDFYYSYLFCFEIKYLRKCWQLMDLLGGSLVGFVLKIRPKTLQLK